MTIQEKTTIDRTIEDLINEPYHLELEHDVDDRGDAGWVASVDELPGCYSQGRTPNEAVASLHDAMRGWMSVALEDGLEIPKPRAEAVFSGKFNVRLPRTLHAELTRAAEAEGVSLNQFVMSALAGAVHWRS